MNKYKTEMMVGVFVVLTIGAILLLALKVANQSMATDGDTYTLYAKFDNIGGLKPRSAVKVGGVTVGRVTSISLDQGDFTPIVELSISNEYNGFPETSSVSILTSGLSRAKSSMGELSLAARAAPSRSRSRSRPVLRFCRQRIERGWRTSRRPSAPTTSLSTRSPM